MTKKEIVKANDFSSYDGHSNTWSCIILNEKGYVVQKIFGKDEKDAIINGKIVADALNNINN